jgi:anti-sigma regulatory factor (Ser/Thr protein kinase)
VDDIEHTVTLGLPPDPGSVAVVRAVVASVASKLAVPYDAVEDLRIAAAEAAAVLLSSGGSGTRLRVDLTPSDRDLCLRMWLEGAGSIASLEDRGGLAWRVIEGLADQAEVIEVDRSSAIELRIRTVAR